MGKRHEQVFHKRGTLLYMKKKHSISLVIREMQIKPTVRYHIIAIQLASIKDNRDQVFAKMWNNDTQGV